MLSLNDPMTGSRNRNWMGVSYIVASDATNTTGSLAPPVIVAKCQTWLSYQETTHTSMDTQCSATVTPALQYEVKQVTRRHKQYYATYLTGNRSISHSNSAINRSAIIETSSSSNISLLTISVSILWQKSRTQWHIATNTYYTMPQNKKPRCR